MKWIKVKPELIDHCNYIQLSASSSDEYCYKWINNMSLDAFILGRWKKNNPPNFYDMDWKEYKLFVPIYTTTKLGKIFYHG